MTPLSPLHPHLNQQNLEAHTNLSEAINFANYAPSTKTNTPPQQSELNDHNRWECIDLYFKRVRQHVGSVNFNPASVAQLLSALEVLYSEIPRSSDGSPGYHVPIQTSLGQGPSSGYNNIQINPHDGGQNAQTMQHFGALPSPYQTTPPNNMQFGFDTTSTTHQQTGSV